MNGKLASRIKRLEAQAAEREAIDRANAPPDFKCWGTPEARSLIAAAALAAALRDVNGPAKDNAERDARSEAADRAAHEIDELIAREGIEAGRRAYAAACEQDRLRRLEPWQRQG